MRRLYPNTIRKILIPMHMGIGDIIMFIPTLRSLKKYFTNSRITVAMRKRYMPLLRDTADEFIPFGGRDASLKDKVSFLLKIRSLRFDMVVKPYLGSTHIFIALSGIHQRVGFYSNRNFPLPFDFIFNRKTQMDQTGHQMDRNLGLFYAAGGIKPVRDFTLKIEHGEVSQAKELLKKSGIGEDDIKVAIAPKTAAEWKEWGVVNFDSVAEELIKRLGAKIILIGRNKGKEEFRNYMLDLFDKTTLIGAAAVLKECNLCITNDGGVMWLSSAVGAPVIAIYGPTDHNRTYPMGSKDRIIRKDLDCSPCYVARSGYIKAKKCKDRRCLKSIKPGEVIEEAINSLKKSLNSG